MVKSRVLVTLLSASLLSATVAACGDDNETERWAQTDNTNVKIDWDKINEAYKAADGPEDLERRVNEIYEGDEVISISVKDEGKEVQTVTGFFDKDKNGQVDEGEKIFTIKRNLEPNGGKATYQTVGYGPHYGYYYSPTYSLATGMVMGAMLSNAFSPRYVPMYTTAYVTSYSRVGHITSSRTSYRAANPSRFSRGTSGYRSGGSYRSGGGGSFRSRGGGFGTTIRGRKTRLDA